MSYVGIVFTVTWWRTTYTPDNSLSYLGILKTSRDFSWACELPTQRLQFLPTLQQSVTTWVAQASKVEVISTTSRQVSDLTICRTCCFSLHTELLWWWPNLPFGARDGDGFLKVTEPSCKGSYVIEKQTCYLTHHVFFFLVLLVWF